MKIKNLKYENIREVNTKGFKAKYVEIYNTKKKPINLQTIKELEKEFNKEANKTPGGFYVITGRNEYRDFVTIRAKSGRFYDEDDNYYRENDYIKDVFDDFTRIQVEFFVPRKKL